MKETRYNLRLTKQEKASLSLAAKHSGISILSYIRQKLFANSDIDEEEISYESPPKSKHEYFNTMTLQTVYMLLLDMLSNNKSTKEILEIKENCKNHARQNIAKQGYLRIEKKPGKDNK